MAPPRDAIAGIVLAGGEGRRMGGVDKGLLPFEGRALVEHAIARLRPQVATVIVVANRNAARYAAWADRVVADRIAGFAGPLAGLHAGLSASELPFALCAPCDAPRLPADLGARLAGAMATRRAALAYARTGPRTHPVFALMRRDLADGLAGFLASGGRKVEDWFATVDAVDVDFDDEREAFRNFNRPEDLA